MKKTKSIDARKASAPKIAKSANALQRGTLEVPRKSDRGKVFFTVGQVSIKLCICERQVWRIIADGDLSTHKIRNSTRISSDDLDAYLDRCRLSATGQE